MSKLECIVLVFGYAFVNGCAGWAVWLVANGY